MVFLSLSPGCVCWVSLEADVTDALKDQSSESPSRMMLLCTKSRPPPHSPPLSFPCQGDFHPRNQAGTFCKANFCSFASCRRTSIRMAKSFNSFNFSLVPPRRQSRQPPPPTSAPTPPCTAPLCPDPPTTSAPSAEDPTVGSSSASTLSSLVSAAPCGHCRRSCRSSATPPTSNSSSHQTDRNPLLIFSFPKRD
ncbi:hypothetical protein CsSME_00022335 [Camellia sinensis var. sinensis]